MGQRLAVTAIGACRHRDRSGEAALTAVFDRVYAALAAHLTQMWDG